MNIRILIYIYIYIEREREEDRTTEGGGMSGGGSVSPRGDLALC